MALGFALLGLALLTFAASFGFGINQAEPLTVVQPRKRFSDVLEGCQLVVSFQVTNHGLNTVRLIGSSDTCGAVGCVRGTNIPLDIAPHGTTKVELMVVARKTGKLSQTISLLTDLPSQPELTVRVEGNVVSLE